MSAVEGYSSNELETILYGALCVVAGTMSADKGGGLIAALREGAAASRFTLGAAEDERFKDNGLVKVYAERFIDSKTLTDDETFKLANHKYDELAIDRMVHMLRHDDDGHGFKIFLYELAEAVAAASGEGLFGTGQRITPGEETFLKALKEKFGL